MWSCGCKVFNPLELDLQWIFVMRMLGTEPRSSARAISDLHLWAITGADSIAFLFWDCLYWAIFQTFLSPLQPFIKSLKTITFKKTQQNVPSSFIHSFILRHGLTYVSLLVWNFLCRLGWPQTLKYPSASTFKLYLLKNALFVVIYFVLRLDF